MIYIDARRHKVAVWLGKYKIDDLGIFLENMKE
jgi:hypothetical protein